jgi:hypothetical protein
MAGKRATSFVKRQKEMSRNARAKEKRATRQTRRDERAAGIRESPLDEIMMPLDGPVEVDLDAVPGSPANDEAEDSSEDDPTP